MKKSIKIIGFCCQNSILGVRDTVGRDVTAFEPVIKIVTLICSSKVETLPIIKAFESGADGVFVLGCPEGKCRLLDGNHRAQKVVEHTRLLLEEIGIDKRRLEMITSKTSLWEEFDQIADTIIKKIKSLK